MALRSFLIKKLSPASLPGAVDHKHMAGGLAHQLLREVGDEMQVEAFMGPGANDDDVGGTQAGEFTSCTQGRTGSLTPDTWLHCGDPVNCRKLNGLHASADIIFDGFAGTGLAQ